MTDNEVAALLAAALRQAEANGLGAGDYDWVTAVEDDLMPIVRRYANEFAAMKLREAAGQMHDPSDTEECWSHAEALDGMQPSWEVDQARRAMDVGPTCACGHGQLEHGESRCKHCACVLPWYAPEFAHPSGEAST